MFGEIKVEENDGTVLWYFNDKLHKEDEPAILFANGTELYYDEGELKCVRGSRELTTY